MLIQGEDVEAEILGVTIFVEVVMIVIGRLFSVEMLVRDCEESAIFQN
jgi:hypothetical protein